MHYRSNTQERQQQVTNFGDIESNVDVFFKGQKEALDADIIKRTGIKKAHLTCPNTTKPVCIFLY